MPTTALERPSTLQEERTQANKHDELSTFRIEIEGTGRWLLNGFHIAPEFMPKDHEAHDAVRRCRIAEFGDVAIAHRVIEQLRHPAPLIVRRQDWGPLAGQPLQDLCVRVDRTGGHANMLFWSPTSRAARALMDMPTGRKMGPKS